MTAEDSDVKKTQEISAADIEAGTGQTGRETIAGSAAPLDLYELADPLPPEDLYPGLTHAQDADMSRTINLTQNMEMGSTADLTHNMDLSQTINLTQNMDMSQTINLTQALPEDSAEGDVTAAAEGADSEKPAGGKVVPDKTRTLVSPEEMAEAEKESAEDKKDGDKKGLQEDGEGKSGPDGGENAEEIDPEIEAIKEKIRERKREKKRKARRRKIRFWTVLTILVVGIGAFLFSISGFFTVDSIEVNGNLRFSDEEIINIAHAVPGHNLLYNTGSKVIIDYLEQNPYIKSATVERKLPSTLVITVNERRQACAFKYDDDYLILDDEGILLKKTRTEPKITMVTGLVVSKIKLGEVIGTQSPQMFTRLMKLIRNMKSADLYFVAIDMTSYEEDRSVKAYIYDKLVVKSSYDALLTNLSNGRLHKVVEKLFEDDTKRGTITIADDGSVSFEPGI